MALAKTLLFLSLLALAALNRFVFSARPGDHLRRSIIGEMALAVLTFMAAALLAHLTPGAHEQPVWPFAWRLNPSTTGPVFIEAHPASFFMSPTGFSADAVVRGEALYQRACASCHGATAQGRGPAAASLSVAPPDLTTDRVRAYSDGDLFWKTGHSGIAADADRWDLVDYLRAHATGEFARTSGRGQLTLRIPKFDAVCAGGEALDRDDLRGKVLRLVVPGDRPLLLPPNADPRLMTISLLAGPDGWPGSALCTAQPGTLRALSILLGTTPEALAGERDLIDGNGWLRARWRPGQRGGWGTPDLLLPRVETLARSPLPADPGSAHIHHH